MIDFLGFVAAVIVAGAGAYGYHKAGTLTVFKLLIFPMDFLYIIYQLFCFKYDGIVQVQYHLWSQG